MKNIQTRESGYSRSVSKLFGTFRFELSTKSMSTFVKRSKLFATFDSLAASFDSSVQL